MYIIDATIKSQQHFLIYLHCTHHIIAGETCSSIYCVAECGTPKACVDLKPQATVFIVDLRYFITFSFSGAQMRSA